MRNPFRKYSNSRGLPDFGVHDGNDYQHNHRAMVVAPAEISRPAPTSSAPSAQLLAPAGYPTVTGGYSYNNSPSTEPPIAIPYARQQDALASNVGEVYAEEKEAEAVWEFNAGNNMNKKGQQKAGNIEVGNTCKGSLPFTLPQNGRFVFNAGNNVNEGENQEAGHVEFANVYA